MTPRQMLMERINQWFSGAVGRAMNPDGMYGLQCKDVVDDYCTYLFGNWTNTIRPGDARVCFDNSNPDFFIKIRNNPNDAAQVPQKGDILVYDGWAANPYGHINIVESANRSAITTIEQDGYLQVPAFRTSRGWYLGGKLPIGWLRPKQDKIIGSTQSTTTQGGSAVETIKSMYWRLLGREADAGGLNHSLNNSKTRGWDFVYNDLKNSAEGQKDWSWRNPDRVRQLETWLTDRDRQISELKVALENEQKKPAKEVIKEVERIVEKPVEPEIPIEPEVPVDYSKENNGLLKTILELLQNLISKITGIFK